MAICAGPGTGQAGPSRKQSSPPLPCLDGSCQEGIPGSQWTHLRLTSITQGNPSAEKVKASKAIANVDARVYKEMHRL
jgi:hypothetical protein